jgi:hypothetical protein
LHVNDHEPRRVRPGVQWPIESRPPGLTWPRPSPSQPNQPPLDLTDHEPEVAGTERPSRPGEGTLSHHIFEIWRVRKVADHS